MSERSVPVPVSSLPERGGWDAVDLAGPGQAQLL